MKKSSILILLFTLIVGMVLSPIPVNGQDTDRDEDDKNCVLPLGPLGQVADSGGGGTGSGEVGLDNRLATHGDLVWAAATRELAQMGATLGSTNLDAPRVAVLIVDEFTGESAFPYVQLWEYPGHDERDEGEPGESLLLMAANIEGFETDIAAEAIITAIDRLQAFGVEEIVVNMSWLIYPCSIEDELNVINYLTGICEAEGEEREALEDLLRSLNLSIGIDELCGIAQNIAVAINDRDDSAVLPSQPLDSQVNFISIEERNPSFQLVDASDSNISFSNVGLVMQPSDDQFADRQARFFAYLQSNLNERDLRFLLRNLEPFFTPAALESIDQYCMTQDSASNTDKAIVDALGDFDVPVDGLCEALQATDESRFLSTLTQFFAYMQSINAAQKLPENAVQYLMPTALDSLIAYCQTGEHESSSSENLLAVLGDAVDGFAEEALCAKIESQKPPNEPEPEGSLEQLRDALRDATNSETTDAQLRQIETFVLQEAIGEMYDELLGDSPSEEDIERIFGDDPLFNLITPQLPEAKGMIQERPVFTGTLDIEGLIGGEVVSETFELNDLVAGDVGTLPPLVPLVPEALGDLGLTFQPVRSAPRVTYIAAAGNSNLNFPFLPALLDNVISVSTVDGRRYTSNSGEIVMPGWHPNGLDEGTSFAAPRLSAWTAVQLMTDNDVCEPLDAPANQRQVQASSMPSTMETLFELGYLAEEGRETNTRATGVITWGNLMSCPKDMSNATDTTLCKDMSLENALEIACE